jgi:hypothetical protein
VGEPENGYKRIHAIWMYIKETTKKASQPNYVKRGTGLARSEKWEKE